MEGEPKFLVKWKENPNSLSIKRVKYLSDSYPQVDETKNYTEVKTAFQYSRQVRQEKNWQNEPSKTGKLVTKQLLDNVKEINMINTCSA